MPVNTQKLVRVLAAPTGPTGTMKRVQIFTGFTGPTGTFPVWGQINAAQQAQSPTGTFEEVYQGTGATGTVKHVIIPGFTGPA